MIPLARRFSTQAQTPGFFELRQYTIRPGSMKTYMMETFAAAQVRKSIFDTKDSRWLSFFSTEIGGDLTMVHHLYWYKDYDARDAVREKAASSVEWGSYLKEARPCMASQHNAALIEAAPTLQVTYELRRYQLKLGYNTVPDFLKLYGVDDSGASTLVTLLYSDSGPLNVVYEVWRHESLQGSLAARQASRQSDKWKEAVASIAGLANTFDTQYLRPTPFSPWQ